jgi:hypothetical protein
MRNIQYKKKFIMYQQSGQHKVLHWLLPDMFYRSTDLVLSFHLILHKLDETSPNTSHTASIFFKGREIMLYLWKNTLSIPWYLQFILLKWTIKINKKQFDFITETLKNKTYCWKQKNAPQTGPRTLDLKQMQGYYQFNLECYKNIKLLQIVFHIFSMPNYLN